MAEAAKVSIWGILRVRRRPKQRQVRQNRPFREVSSKLANSGRKQLDGARAEYAVQPIPLRPASGTEVRTPKCGYANNPAK
jgi:hypothetical protein